MRVKLSRRVVWIVAIALTAGCGLAPNAAKDVLADKEVLSTVLLPVTSAASVEWKAYLVEDCSLSSPDSIVELLGGSDEALLRPRSTNAAANYNEDEDRMTFEWERQGLVFVWQIGKYSEDIREKGYPTDVQLFDMIDPDTLAESSCLVRFRFVE